jgi:hypothetical protein
MSRFTVCRRKIAERAYGLYFVNMRSAAKNILGTRRNVVKDGKVGLEELYAKLHPENISPFICILGKIN